VTPAEAVAAPTVAAAIPVAPATEAATTPVLVAQAETPAVTIKTAAVASTKPLPNKETLLVATANNLSDYTVASGDTLFNISRRYDLTVAELKSLNDLSADKLKLGQVLKVKGKPNLVASRSAQDDANAQVATLKPARAVPVEYVVQSGDTLFSIARKFGVRHTDVQSKSRYAHRLTPGQRVWIQGL
jgi:membrane-bound lytic murein transglycosylase D